MEDYACNLGRLMGNLHSLEFSLRAFLLARSQSKATSIADISRLATGDTVPENAFTNYDSLGQLIDKYDKLVTPLDASLAIGPDVVDVRDAIAHGRLSSIQPSPPMTLLKFSRPKDGQVSVTHAISVDVAWLRVRYMEVAALVLRVADADQRLPK